MIKNNFKFYKVILIVLIVVLIIVSGCNVRKINNCEKSGGKWTINKENPIGSCKCPKDNVLDKMGSCIIKTK